MKRKKVYFNACWAIEKDEAGWDFLIATPHIEIQRIPLDNSNDWHITINLLLFMMVIGWETKNRGKQ